MKQGSIKTFLFLSNNKKRTYEPDQPEDAPIRLDDSDSSPVDPTPTTPTSSSCQSPKRKRKRSNPDEDTTATPVTSLPSFPMLGKMAKLVLTLPHSNASVERVFSLIRYNKTDSRNWLENGGSLSSIMTIKLANPESSQNCYKFEPPKEVVLKSKSVTWEYNKAYSSSQ